MEQLLENLLSLCLCIALVVNFINTVFRLPELLDEFKIAKNQPDDSYKKLMRKYTKKELLIIDECFFMT